MIEQPETQNNVLTSSVSQNPVASELDGDAIDSAVQDVIRKNELNQYKKTPVLTPVQQLTPIENAVNETIKRNNESNKTALNQSLVSASGKDPDTAAKSQALATSLNVSTGVVDFDIELAKRQKLLMQVEAKNLAEKYPSLARSFLDKDFAEVAHDDIDNLAQTSNLANELRGSIPVGMGSGDKTLFGETATTYASEMFTDFERGMISGTNTTTYGELAYQAQIPALTTRGLEQRPDLEQAIQYAESVFSEQEEYRGTWSESFGTLIGQMSSMMVEASAVGTVFGGAAAVAGQLGPQIAFPEEAITVPAAVGLGFTTSLIDQTRKVETGSAFVEYYRGSEDYEPMSYEEAAWAANIVGTINASIELASTAFFFAPFVGALPKAFLKKTVVNGLRKATTKSGATRVAVTHLIKSAVTEPAQEVVQEGTIIVAREIAGALTDPNFQSALSTQEGRDRIEERVSSIFEMTFKGALPLAFIVGGFSLAHQTRNIAKSQKRQKLLTDLISAKGESKLDKRSKPTYNSYLAEQLSGESLHIGVEQFEQARRKNGVSLQEVEKIIPGITEQVAKAKASGGDVVIPTSLYLSELIDTEFGVSIRNDIRADAEGMSINEIAESQEFLKELKSINKQAVEDFKKTNKDWAESAGKIEEEVFAKIKAAGNYTEEEARMLAQWHRDTAVVLASRFGMTPKEFNAKFGLSIESAYTPEQQAPAQGSFEQASRADLGLGQQAAPAPDSGVFDANNPPVSSEAIFALMDADGKIYYDINATMHGDLVETFPGITDTVIDGGFIVNGKYMMGKSDGGYSAFEGEQKQIDAVRNFTEQANTQGFKESNYRPAVVAWAKEKFGDRTAPDGSTVWQNFTEWFGDSKVVDAEGKPMVVYHGGEFGRTVFADTGGRVDSAYKQGTLHSQGIWLTRNRGSDIVPESGRSATEAMTYAENYANGVVYPLYVTIKNPAQVDDRNIIRNSVTVESLKAQGHDGAFLTQSGVWVAFEPAQIKSAIANAGQFSATDPNILRQDAVLAAFYSALSVEVNKLTTKSAIADSWKQQIKGLIAKGVIKEREVFWSGLNNWLDLQEGKITKEQVQAFLAAGGVKVELTRLEERKGQGGWYFDIDGDVYDSERKAEEAADSYSLQQAQDKFDSDSSIDDSYLLMREGETIETFYDEDEARQALAELEDSENASIEERYEIIINGNSYGVYGDRTAAQEDANNVINEWADALRRNLDIRKVDDDDSNASKFSAYQLPGGTNYREVLVTLPVDQKVRDAGQAKYNELADAGMSLMEAKEQAKKLLPQEFRSSHWDQTNVLVHLRMNDRVEVEEIERRRIVRNTDGERPWKVFVEGENQHQISYATQAEADADVAEYPTFTDRIKKRTLFVEEVQSDWGQQGREKGFVSLIWKAALEKEGIKLVKESALKRDNALQALGSWRNEKWEGRPTPEMLDMILSMSHLGSEWANRFGIESDSDIATINDYIQTARRSVAVDRQLTEMDSHIPVAPFVETTSGWLELGLKQIMLEAVNGKYDRVAFVDGDQSVERYRKALTQAVDEVEIQRNDDGTYTYNANKGGGTIQREASVSAKRIGEVFGKAGSKQLLEQADANPNDIHTISSEDIEIGGEGMRKFYDTIVPQALNKMLKKLGGDKVENVNMITEKPVTQEQINAAERRRDFTESERLTLIYERQQLGRGISEKGEQQVGEQQGFTVTPALAAQVNQGLPLFQSAQNKPARGWFDPKQLKAMLGSKSDITTFFHELAHYYLTVYSRVASDPQSPSQIREDMDIILSWFGIAGETPEQRLATWNAMTLEEQRPHHEAFAYNKEIYVSEGKSPSIEMQGVFERFGQFIKRIYISIRDDLNAIYKQEFGTDLPMMTGEIRRVMDRMIATDEQIRSAEERRNMEDTFRDQELSGMDDAQWASYQQMRAEATQKSVSELNEQSLAATTWASRLKANKVKEIQAEQEELRSEIRKQVKKEVESRNVYRAIKFLKYGILQTAGGEEVEFTGSNKLNTNAVKLMVPKENMDKFGSGKNGMVALDGYHPDIVSERFNYSSGDELILAILDAKPMDEVIDGITEDRMEIENGELNSPQAIEAAADKAVHNEARVKLVAVELRWLSKATQPVRAMIAAAKSVAKQMLETKRLRDIKPGDYASAAARAAKESQTAYFATQSAETAAKTAYTRHYNKMIAEGAEEAKAVEMATKVSDEALAKAESRSEAHKKKYGKMKPSEVAAQAKRSQLLQEQLALEANDAIDQVKKSLKYLRNVLSDKNVQKIGADNSDQIALLLERFELKNISLKEMDKRTSLADWIAGQLELGLEVDISKELVDQANKISYRNMTLSQFNDLVDAVKTIEYMGKNENAILTAAKKAVFKEKRDEIVKSIIENAGDRKASTRTPKSGTIGAVTNQITRFLAAQFKAASVVRILDGGKDDGPLWNYLIRSANKSGDKETTMRATATEAVSKILNPLFKLGKMGGKGKFFVSVNESLNREEKLVIALNMGNEGNTQRMLDGYGWTLEQVIPILESMTTEELNAVQEIWDHFETYKNEISDKSRRIYGKDLDFVEPNPIQIKSASGEIVSLRGGYYPAKYDPMASLAAENYNEAEKAKDLLRAAHISATTSRGYSKQRAAKVVDRPLIRNLSALYAGLNEVIHDLSWHEWTIDANKLMRDNAFDKEIRDRYGPAFKNQLKSWIKDVAAGEKGMDTDADIALNFLRQGVSSAGLGFNLTSAALQVTGFNQSIIRVGPKYIGYGIMQVMKRGIGAFREVNELSEFMANRSRTQFRELNELRNRVQGQSAAMKRVRMGTYFLMMKMQRSVDVPTWIGAYAKQLEINPDEQLAIDIADQTVIDTQGGGQIKDLSAVERGGAGTKLFTVFYGYMNTVYNMAAVQTMTEKKRGKLAADYVMLFVVPVVLSYALKKLLKPSKDDDDEFDFVQLSKDLSIEQIQYLMGTMVVAREFSQIAKTMIDPSAPSMGYGGPAGVRMIGDTYTAATQIGQGEFDSAFRKSAINLIGDATGLPSAQINRTIDGIEALMEDETTDIRAPLFGVRK
jgi:hypothetical protein